MAHTSLHGPYKWLAQYYDELFEPLRFPLDEARRHALGEILPAVGSACDLACGTGTTALSLARAGISTFAVDGSAGMCRRAREKARRQSVPLRVLRADFRSFRLPRLVDLVTCEGDALNHVASRADLLSVARAVAHALRPGGYFYFDVNNREGFRQYWASTVWLEGRHVALVMRNDNDYRHDHAWSDLVLFSRQGRTWSRHHERIDEVCWTAREIRNALKNAGFDRIRAWDAAPFFKSDRTMGRSRVLVQPGCRTIYLARRA